MVIENGWMACSYVIDRKFIQSPSSFASPLQTLSAPSRSTFSVDSPSDGYVRKISRLRLKFLLFRWIKAWILTSKTLQFLHYPLHFAVREHFAWSKHEVAFLCSRACSDRKDRKQIISAGKLWRVKSVWCDLVTTVATSHLYHLQYLWFKQWEVFHG